MRYPDLPDKEIERLMNAISFTIDNIKKDIKKDKLKALGKTLLTVVMVASGITVSIIFPNPITIGVLGGAATLWTQNSGLFGKVKKIRKKKEEVKDMIAEQHNREVAKNVQTIIYQQEIRDNQVEPSAPEIYPDLKKL